MSDFQKFAQTIKKKKFSRIYLIHGNEDFFITRAVDLLIENAVGKSERSFNLDIFDGAESNSDDVLSSMLSFPFVGERRLTVIKRFDRMDKKYRLDVIDHVGDLPDSNILCLAAGEIKASEEPYKKLPSIAETLAFNRLKGTDLTEFVVETATSLGKEMETGSVDLLVDLTGDSLGDLASEIEKLALYVGDKQKIQIEDVSTLVGKSRTFNIFELQRAVGQRNGKRAQEIASKMLGTGEKPVYIDFMLTRYFLNLMQVKHCHGKGMNAKDMSVQVFGRWNPFIDEYISAARAYSIPEIKSAVAALLDVDVKLKTGGYGDADAIVMILSEIMGRKVSKSA